MAYTILGMYQYDQRLFDSVKSKLPTWEKRLSDYPENMAELLTIEPDVLINRLLMVCGQFEPLYANWDIMEMCISVWASVNALSWQRLYDSCNLKYNPIWNVDGSVEHTETETRNLTQTDTGTIGDSGKNVVDRTTTGSVSAYNVDTFEPREQAKNTGSDTVNNTRTLDTEHGDKGTVERKLMEKRAGNIGVTMTQDMIKKEREIALYSVYDAIVDSFKSEFCILVY